MNKFVGKFFFFFLFNKNVLHPFIERLRPLIQSHRIDLCAVCNYFSMTTSKKEIHHNNVLMGLTDPTPFLPVVRDEAPLTVPLDREHLLGSEGKRIKN